MKTDSLVIKLSVLVTAVGLAGSAFASPMIVELQGGDTGDAFNNWASSSAANDTDTTPLGGASGSFDIGGGSGVDVGGQDAIEITHNQGDATPVQDIFYTTAANFTGDLSQYAGVSFDFYSSQANGATAVSLYFQGATSGNIWYYDIGGVANGWDSYFAPFVYSFPGNWWGLDDNAGTYEQFLVDSSATFATDLADVASLGLRIEYDTTVANQTYGIDDLGLTVPEPETYMVLGMALLTVAFVFRRRISESLAEARAMMQL